MTEKEIQDLALRYFQGETTLEEETKLHQWYERQIINEETIIIKTDGENIDDVKKRLFSKLQAKITKDKVNRENHIWNKKWMYYAASVIFILSFSIAYFYLKHSDSAPHYTQLLKNDVGPGGNNAILELANGSIINLDQAKKGNLVKIDGITVTKLADGKLSFIASDDINAKLNQSNTVRTPKGGQYQIELPDGTNVWLNASSKIKFPSAFASNLREVELEGEAYFEVAKLPNEKNTSVPFIVKNKNQQIEVLGTHFNVNSYVNEETVKTTLLEGSVRIQPIGSIASKFLKPGQESNVYNGKIEIQPADIESVIAWKNGDFIFNNESLQSVMRKIERWYDVEIIYQSGLLDLKFSGAVSRSRNLSEVLKIMELTGKVEFKIEGRRVIVMV